MSVLQTESHGAEEIGAMASMETHPGLVAKAARLERMKKISADLNIHGGRTRVRLHFRSRISVDGGQGYVVLYRIHAQYQYGQDLGHHSVIATRVTIQRSDGGRGRSHQNVVTFDEKKLGVTGGSGGGLLTNGCGQTAALPQPSLSAISQFGKLVVHGGRHIVPAKLVSSSPFEDPDEYRCAPNQLHSQREDADDVSWAKLISDTAGAGGEQIFAR